MKKAILLFIVMVAFASCTNNYSQGERVGIITKFSNNGFFWKSWDGDLKVAPNIANGGMVGQYEDFYFAIDNDNLVQCTTPTDSINQFMKEGVPVEIVYQQSRGLNWFDNRGRSDYFVKSISRTKK